MRKQVLDRMRVRTPPREGFSWVDRRFVRDYASRMGRDAVLLYLFLSAVADKQGLSYYGAESIFHHAGIGPEALGHAREELIRLDLIAHKHPQYQVLSLPIRETHCQEPLPLGNLFAILAKKGAS